jgi:hypothetical protein
VKKSREYTRFTELVDMVISIPHSIVKKRIEEHRKESARNPNRPGPKRKVNASASAHGVNGQH